MNRGQKPTPQSSLEYFLRLAGAQLRNRLKDIESKEPYSERIGRMRLLEELIKEQLPDENPGSATGTTR